MSTLVNTWAASRETIVLTFDDGTKPPFFPLDSRVRHQPMALNRTSRWFGEGVLNNAHRVRLLRARLRRESPDIIVSFGDRTNVVTLLAARPLRIPTVVSERVDPRLHDLSPIWRLLRRAVYPSAAAVVVQTERTRLHFAARINAAFVVIPNPVSIATTLQDDGDPEDTVIVGMGRLERQKGFDLLLRAFAGMSDRFAHWRLVIAGEGSLRPALETGGRELGIARRVSLPGIVPADALLGRAGIFALTSYFEGFPNVLAEAMAHGRAVVATDCPTGPAELITHGVNGLLIPVGSVEALRAALEKLAGDAVLRRQLGRAARRAVDPYRIDRVLQQWDDLVRRVARMPVRHGQ